MKEFFKEKSYLKTWEVLVIVTIAMILSFLLGIYVGKQHVIYNAIISDEAQTSGTYQMTIDGQTHEYYFEK